MILLLASNVFGQEMGSGSYREGYGSYGTMGQNPDDLMKYGRDMMRYGFLVKKSPDTNTALSFQNEISETRGIFEQHMIEHIIRMKKINLDAERK